MDFLRKILLHVSAICCFACIITAILDWYNPYMAFFEHIGPLRIMLCTCRSSCWHCCENGSVRVCCVTGKTSA